MSHISVTVESVRKAIELIGERARVGDYEMAHAMECDLHVEVLEKIAEGNLSVHDAANLAREATMTAKIDYPRFER